MDFKKSRLSSSLNSNYTRSENWYGLKRPGLKTGVENYIFFVWNRVRIWRSGWHTPTENSQDPPPPPFPTPRTYQVSKRNTLSYIKRKLIHPDTWNSHEKNDGRCFGKHLHGHNRKPNIEIELYWTVPRSPKCFSRVWRDASVSAAGRQIFGRRQKSIEAKGKRKRKKLFAWVTINKDF